MLSRAVLVACLFLHLQDKKKPTAEDKKPFNSDSWKCTVKKPAGKELDWKFVTQNLPPDGIVLMDHALVMGFRVFFRGQKPAPNQTIKIDDSGVKRYQDGVMGSKNFKNTKCNKNSKIQFPTTGDECWVLEFEYEPLKNPDPWVLIVWLFVAKANGIHYVIEAYCPKNQFKLSKPAIDTIVRGFTPKP